MQSLLRIKRLVWALAVVIVTVVLTFTYFSGRRYVTAMESVQHTLEVTSTIDSVVAAVIDEETGQRGFLLTNEESFLEPYGANFLGVGWTKRQEDVDRCYRVMLEVTRQERQPVTLLV